MALAILKSSLRRAPARARTATLCNTLVATRAKSIALPPVQRSPSAWALAIRTANMESISPSIAVSADRIAGSPEEAAALVLMPRRV